MTSFGSSLSRCTCQNKFTTPPHQYTEVYSVPNKIADKLIKYSDTSSQFTRNLENNLYYMTLMIDEYTNAKKSTTAISANWNYLPTEVKLKACKIMIKKMRTAPHR